MSKKKENICCITLIAIFFDIAVSGAIIPIMATFLGIILEVQVVVIGALQVILGVCFYKAWKPILRMEKARRSFNLSPHYYTEVEPRVNLGKEVEVKIEEEGPEEEEVRLYATIERDTNMICIFAHTGYNSGGELEGQKKIFSEMLFIEEVDPLEFAERYLPKKGGKKKCRESFTM